MSEARGNAVAARIRAARAWADLKRSELGERIGVSERQVTRLESGSASANYELRQAVAEACDVPMWFLEDGFDGTPADVFRSTDGRLAELAEGQRLLEARLIVLEQEARQRTAGTRPATGGQAR